MDFAEEHVDFAPEYWNDVVFLDEKVFSTSEDGRRNVWRPRHKTVDPKYVVQIKHSGRISMGYWGFIAVAGAGGLLEIGGRLNAAGYINLLENHLKPQVRAVMSEEDFPIVKVVQDDSGVHRAHIVREWFDNNPHFEKINWPALAQDLNPIENVWGVMQRSWRSGELRSKVQLRQKVSEVWQTFQEHDNLCERLVFSLPLRLREVLNNNGYWCSY